VDGHDPDGAAQQVIIGSYENSATRVCLHDCRFIGEYETTFVVDLHSDGLDARIGEVSVTPWDCGGLTGFMDGLAADFRGWSGTPSWAVNHLKLTATFHSGGHVELCWTIRPWITRADWEASLTTWIEGGQQMTELAAAIKALLTQAQPVQLQRFQGGTATCARETAAQLHGIAGLQAGGLRTGPAGPGRSRRRSRPAGRGLARRVWPSSG